MNDRQFELLMEALQHIALDIAVIKEILNDKGGDSVAKPSNPKPTIPISEAEARLAVQNGYDPKPCMHCGAYTMVVNSNFEKCNTCGEFGNVLSEDKF